MSNTLPKKVYTKQPDRGMVVSGFDQKGLYNNKKSKKKKKNNNNTLHRENGTALPSKFPASPKDRSTAMRNNNNAAAPSPLVRNLPNINNGPPKPGAVAPGLLSRPGIPSAFKLGQNGPPGGPNANTTLNTQRSLQNNPAQNGPPGGPLSLAGRPPVVLPNHVAGANPNAPPGQGTTLSSSPYYMRPNVPQFIGGGGSTATNKPSDDPQIKLLLESLNKTLKDNEEGRKKDREAIQQTIKESHSESTSSSKPETVDMDVSLKSFMRKVYAGKDKPSLEDQHDMSDKFKIYFRDTAAKQNFVTSYDQARYIDSLNIDRVLHSSKLLYVTFCQVMILGILHKDLLISQQIQYIIA